MIWEAAPTGRRGRQQTYSGKEDQKTAWGAVFPTNAIQTCLSMKVLFGIALRQTTGFVESLLRLVGLNWTVPDFSTLSRRQKTLAVNSPYRGSKGPLHLLIPSRDIASQCPAGQWTAPASRSRAKANGTPASMAVPNDASGARSISGLMRKHWRSALSRSPGATSVMPRCYPVLPGATRPARPDRGGRADRQRHCRRCLRHTSMSKRYCRPWRPCRHPVPQEREALEDHHRRGAHHCLLTNGGQRLAAKRGPARGEIPGPRALATMERIPPPKPRRDKDALCEVAGAAPYGAGLRPSARRTPGPHRRPERLHRPRHTRHGSCGIGPSGKGEPRPSPDLCNRVLSAS